MDLMISSVYDDFEFYPISNKVNKTTYMLSDILRLYLLPNQIANLFDIQNNEQFDLF